jgi:outer membrane protein assembly factor BamB
VLALAVFALAAGGCRGPKDIAWSFTTPRPWVLAGDSQAFTPVIADSAVFFCGGYAEKGNSALYALDLVTGKPRWQQNVGSCAAAPLVSAGALVGFGSAGQGDRIVVYGLDRDSGAQKWKIELPGNPHPPAPVGVGDFVFFAPGSRSVLRIDARDGSLDTFDIDADLNLTSDSLWVSSAPAEGIFGYGKSFWRSPTNSNKPEAGVALSESAGRPMGVASDGRVLLLADDEGTLRAFDLGKGTVIWRHHWDKILSAPLLAGDKVFLNVYRQKYALTAIALTSGDELWQIPEGSTNAPFWHDGRLYAASGITALMIDETSGRISSRLAAPTAIMTTPLPAGDLLLFGTARGALYAARTRR